MRYFTKRQTGHENKAPNKLVEALRIKMHDFDRKLLEDDPKLWNWIHDLNTEISRLNMKHKRSTSLVVSHDEKTKHRPSQVFIRSEKWSHGSFVIFNIHEVNE